MIFGIQVIADQTKTDPPTPGRLPLIQWIPTTDQVGSDEVQLVVVDGQGGRDVQAFDINVAGANRPPRVDSSPSPAAYLGETYRYDVVASDPDGHSLTYSLDASTTAGGDIDLDPITGRLTWNPAATGDFRVQVNVVDELGLGVGHVFGVRVAASRPNNAPRFDADTAPPFSVSRSSTDAASVYTYDFGATDPDGDPVTFAFGTRSPDDATITPGGVVTWTVPADQPVGTPVALDIVATDVPPGTATPRSATYGYTVQIQPENFAPTIEPIGDRQVVAGNQLRIDVRARDQNAGDVISYSISDNATEAGLAIDDLGRITWGTDVGDVTDTPVAVVVTASDGQRSTTEAFSVTVSADTTGPEAEIYTTDTTPGGWGGDHGSVVRHRRRDGRFADVASGQRHPRRGNGSDRPGVDLGRDRPGPVDDR